MSTNQSPERRYLVSLILASFWGFLGLKEAYNRKWPLAIVRLITSLATLVLFTVNLTSPNPAVVANIAVILLTLWLVVDSLRTYQAKTTPLKEQKQVATTTDLSTAKYIIGVMLALSLCIIAWMAIPTYNHFTRTMHVTNAQDRARELVEPFSQLEHGMTRTEVTDIMGRQHDSCTQEFKGVKVVSGVPIGDSYLITCTYGLSLSDGISTADPDENYQSHTIQLRFVRYELLPAFAEEFEAIAPKEFVLDQKEFIQRFY